MVYSRSVHQNDFVQYADKFKVTAVETVTKTDKDYVWVVKDEESAVCSLITGQPSPDPNFKHFLALYDCLHHHYGQVLKQKKINSRFTMKTIRCYYATEWVKKKTECELTGEVVPPNPLQHDSAKTTEYYYAAKGSSSVEEARKRLHLKSLGQERK